MKVIRLYVNEGLIMARHIDEYEKPDQEIITRWGTHELPTAFFANNNMNEVRETIQNLNPDKVVVCI